MPGHPRRVQLPVVHLGRRHQPPVVLHRRGHRPEPQPHHARQRLSPHRPHHRHGHAAAGPPGADSVAHQLQFQPRARQPPVGPPQPRDHRRHGDGEHGVRAAGHVLLRQPRAVAESVCDGAARQQQRADFPARRRGALACGPERAHGPVHSGHQLRVAGLDRHLHRAGRPGRRHGHRPALQRLRCAQQHRRGALHRPGPAPVHIQPVRESAADHRRPARPRLPDHRGHGAAAVGGGQHPAGIRHGHPRFGDHHHRHLHRPGRYSLRLRHRG